VEGQAQLDDRVVCAQGRILNRAIAVWRLKVMRLSLDIVTTLCIGWLIGAELAVWVFINPILRQLEQPARFAAIRLFAQRLGAAMPFWYVVSFLLLIVEAVLRRQAPGEPLLIAACAIWAAVIVHTLLFLVPINNRIARNEFAASPESFLREHKKWDMRHRLRVIALAVAMVCFLLAVGAATT
jgi:hypothetical protein